MPKLNQDLSTLKHFIKEVEKRPELYDFRQPEYNSKLITDKLWGEIAKKFQISVEDCKRKWHNIRTGYVRSINRTPKSGSNRDSCRPYYLAKHLNFLRRHTCSRKQKRNSITKEIIETHNHKFQSTPIYESSSQESSSSFEILDTILQNNAAANFLRSTSTSVSVHSPSNSPIYTQSLESPSNQTKESMLHSPSDCKESIFPIIMSKSQESSMMTESKPSTSKIFNIKKRTNNENSNEVFFKYVVAKKTRSEEDQVTKTTANAIDSLFSNMVELAKSLPEHKQLEILAKMLDLIRTMKSSV